MNMDAKTLHAGGEGREEERSAPAASDTVLSLDEIARYLKVSEEAVLALVGEADLPGVRASNQWRFVKAAIDDWLTTRMQHSPSEKLADVVSTVKNARKPLVPVPRLVTEDRILMDLQPGKPERVLEQMVAPLVKDGVVSDRERYLNALMERERVVSTAIGEGIALPHAVTPESSGVQENGMALGICPQGTDFESLDGLPTHLFFLIASVSAQAHLRMMAKAMLLLRIPGMKAALVSAQQKDAIIQLLIKSHEDLSMRLW